MINTFYRKISSKTLKLISYLYPLGLMLPFKEKELEETNNKILNKKDSDVLLLIPINKIKNNYEGRKSFYNQNWSCTWINTLEQEAGYFSVSDSIKDLKSKKLVIMSKGFPFSKNIETYVKNGGVLLLEKPDRELFDIKIKEKNLKAKSVTNHNLDMPLNTIIDEVEWEGSKVKLEIDNMPAILTKKIGKGYVILLAFDYGMQLVSLQQGVPSDDYSVRHKFGLIGITEPADMIIDKKFLNNNIPYADIFEKYLFDIINEFTIIPKWWYFPYDYNSAIIMSYDEDYFGEKSVMLFKEEIQNKIPSTFFINSPMSISNQIIAYLKNNNVEIGLHWDRFPNELFFKKQPTIDLKKQIIKSNQKNIISTRIHFLKWGNHYTNTFRILCYNKIKIDSTYGANFGKGYAFSASKFFHPIDTNGILMPILELPFQVMEKRGGVDLNYINKIMEDNNNKFHGCLCFNFHPSKHEYSRPIRKQIIKQALEQRALMINLRDYYNFYLGRLNSEIKSNGKNITVNAKVDMALMLPDYIKKIMIDNKRPEMRKIDNYFIIKIKKGKHKIKVK